MLPADELIGAQLPILAQHIAEGIPILGLEPSCLLSLKDEWPELVPGSESRRVAAAAELAECWFVKQVQAGRCDVRFQEIGNLKPEKKTRRSKKRSEIRKSPARCLLHGHCHQKALEGISSTVAALQLVPGLKVTALDAGCCGMAGSFGYEKEHYDLSVAIAGLELLPNLTAELAADPDTLIVANGTSCRHQIKDLIHHRALHPLHRSIGSSPGCRRRGVER